MGRTVERTYRAPRHPERVMSGIVCCFLIRAVTRIINFAVDDTLMTRNLKLAPHSWAARVRLHRIGASYVSSAMLRPTI